MTESANTLKEIKTDQDYGEIYRGVLDTLREGVYITNQERKISFWNTGADAITGFSEDQMVGQYCHKNGLKHIDEQGKVLCDSGKCPVLLAIREGEISETETFLRHHKGHRVPVFVRTAPIRSGQGDIVGACEVFSDISSKMAIRKQIQELEKLAMLDYLTQLANRRYVDKELERRVQSVRDTHMGVGVIFYDIDHFKQINDNYGHDVGDKVIRMVSATLRNTLRAADLIGRWGGEEFIEIVPNLDQKVLEKIAERNRVLIEKSKFKLVDQEVAVTVSIGATMIQPEDDMESLQKRADQLMYQSKSQGRNRVSMG
ncbi:MAG: diguanylate cyclase [Magnetococcales bacterium]|nr:diguanylate cyclase [Magnetococcales bacterium]